MTYRAARDRIVAMVEEITPQSIGMALGESFHHDVKGLDSKVGAPGRRFWLTAISGGTVAPSSGFTTRRNTTIVLTVEYPAMLAQTDEADVAIVEDYDDIAAKLVDGRHWQRSTSTIVAISADGQDLALPYTVERTTQGWRLRLTFTLEYEA